MDIRFKDELASMPDLRHRLRRLRWFRATFRASARAVTEAYGVRFAIDDARLTRAFLDWIEIAEAEKRFAEINRADFIVFAAGLVLRELIRHDPAKATGEAAHPNEGTAVPQSTEEIVRFWPEGFLYTNYCVSAVAAIHEQEFGAAPAIDKCADDLRTWWSYRENVTEMPAYAVAFLDRFLGSEPNWIAPDHVPSRRAMQQVLQSLSGGTPAGLPTR
ncbi:hypothetical protein ASD64_09935 [Mesorhizobium sp. Root157]|uniref:hypothetical protein n=1 Tax=Mesorhizobium sp. Root157 TaxID=1736477 RepID=UPI0006F4D3A3|nr:hypothetical protein [Mesorhizobium sp. Root157]KQZ81314.1 hypothetical protein ASD64_09935 [Mesorhizobium sp. Root157]